MFVLFSDLMMSPAQIKSIDTTCRLQNDRITQFSGGYVVVAVHEHRQSILRLHVDPEHLRRRVIFVFSPTDSSSDTFSPFMMESNSSSVITDATHHRKKWNDSHHSRRYFEEYQ